MTETIVLVLLGIIIGVGIAKITRGDYYEKESTYPCVKIDDTVTVCAKDIQLRYPQLEEVEEWQNKIELRF